MHIGTGSNGAQDVGPGFFHGLRQWETLCQKCGDGRRQRAARAMAVVRGNAGAFKALAQARKVNPVPVAIWLAGIAFYHLMPMVSTLLGAALPTLMLCFVLAFATRPSR